MTHDSWRTGGRRGIVLLAALSLLVVGAPASQGAETTGTKNLSTPVILVDQDTMSAGFNPVTVPGAPTGTADYVKDGQNYYTGVAVAGADADTWGASWVFENARPVSADVKWGDNLLSHTFSGNENQPIRVEVNLFATATTTATYGTMLGYTTVSLQGTQQDEVFGTLGIAEPLTAMVFTPKATISILQYDPATRWYSKVVAPDTVISGEVNGSGKVIYGFNWGTSSGLLQPGVGNYRLIFKVAKESLVTLDKAVVAADSTEGTGNTPYVFGDKIGYLDIPIGTTPLSPALPFMKMKSDFNGDTNADLIARDTKGNLWLYPGNGKGGWLSKVKVGNGWNIMTAIVAPGDFNGDGQPDLLARDTSGILWLYPGDGVGGWLTRVKVGTGWGSLTALVGPGDFNGDGHVDVLARDASGNLWLYPGSGKASWLAKVKVGIGWSSLTALVGPGDFNGDRNPDLLARDKLGNLWLYPGSGKGGWLPKVKVGVGWSSFTALTSPSDFNGDKTADLLARDKSGNLLLYPGNGKGGWLAKAKVGIGWNAMTMLVS